MTVTVTADDVRKACLELVTVNGRPFSLMGDSGFRKLVEPLLKINGLDETCTVSSSTARDSVILEAAEVRESIRQEVKVYIISNC